MEWNDSLAEEIKTMAACAYTHKQIANALGITADLMQGWMMAANHPASVGLYSSELAVRQSVFQLARSGSSPAQTLAVKLFDETRKTLRREGIGEEEI